MARYGSTPLMVDSSTTWQGLRRRRGRSTSIGTENQRLSAWLATGRSEVPASPFTSADGDHRGFESLAPLTTCGLFVCPVEAELAAVMRDNIDGPAVVHDTDKIMTSLSHVAAQATCAPSG